MLNGVGGTHILFILVEQYVVGIWVKRRCAKLNVTSLVIVRTRSDTIPINPDPEPYRLISPPHLDLAMPFPVSLLQIRAPGLVSL